MSTKRWSYFFLYLARVFILLILLAVILPKFAAVFNTLMSSRLHNEQRPFGNPLRVQTPEWNQFVIKLFPATLKE